MAMCGAELIHIYSHLTSLSPPPSPPLVYTMSLHHVFFFPDDDGLYANADTVSAYAYMEHEIID